MKPHLTRRGFSQYPGAHVADADDYQLAADITAIINPAIVEEQHLAQRNAMARAVHDASYWHAMRDAGVPAAVAAICIAMRAATDTV